MGQPSRLGLLGRAGVLCCTAGALVLGFLCFQLFGSDLLQANAQQRLRQAIEPGLPRVVRTLGRPVPAPATKSPPGGTPLGTIAIPAIGVDQVFLQGTGEAQLQLGPGHYPSTPLPGQRGDAAIAGHRTTWGHPFNRLDQLRLGQAIIVTTPQGRFTFRVQWIAVVAPTDLAIITHTTGASLTLTTCNPKYSAATRLVVHAALAGVGVPTVHELQTLRRISLPTTLAIVPSSAGGWLAGLWGTMALSVLAALFIGVARRRWVALALLPLFGCCFLMCSYWLSGLLPQSF